MAGREKTIKNQKSVMRITIPKQESFTQTGEIYKKSQDTSINVPLKKKYFYIIYVYANN